MFDILLQPDPFNAVRVGVKRTVIRRGHLTNFGPARLVNSENSNFVIEIDIRRTVLTTLDQLTEEDARADGFLSLGQLLSAMQHHYPDIVVTEPGTIYHFVRTDRAGG